MKHNARITVSILLPFIFVLVTGQIVAQVYNCVLKAPLINLDFGAGRGDPGVQIPLLAKYKPVVDICPQDGYYSFVPFTTGCFNDDWFTMEEDHTPGDHDGNMMLVNASETGGIFFTVALPGLPGNTTYQFAAWMLNVCRIKGGCPPLPPNIHITLKTITGQVIGDFTTGILHQTVEPHWTKYAGLFTTPAGVNELILIMEDNTLGGCGNDFALDDITIRECIKPLPAVASPPVDSVKPVVRKPVVKQLPVKSAPVKNKIPVIQPGKSVAESAQKVPEKRPEINTPPLPEPIANRANPIIKHLETEAATIQIDLYDNGDIDGDTVSIYHNNKLIVSRAGLSDKPITFRVDVSAAEPHHELVMVANNLGSIPPNTSVMVVTVNGKRSEVFISSSQQKNAKVVIDLEK